jgi:hypothetical protein
LLNGNTTTWHFDTLGRLQTEVDPIGTFTFAYDGVTSRLQQLSYPNGQTSTYSYYGNTQDRRLQEIHHQTGTGTTLSDFQYAYDRVGNITTWTQQYGTDVKAYDFTYDNADQLIGAVYRTTDPTPTIVKRYGYTYDTAGNRTTARVDDAPVTFSYSTMNQLTSQAGGGAFPDRRSGRPLRWAESLRICGRQSCQSTRSVGLVLEGIWVGSGRRAHRSCPVRWRRGNQCDGCGRG